MYFLIFKKDVERREQEEKNKNRVVRSAFFVPSSRWNPFLIINIYKCIVIITFTITMLNRIEAEKKPELNGSQKTPSRTIKRERSLKIVHLRDNIMFVHEIQESRYTKMYSVVGGSVALMDSITDGGDD